jgi:MFS transporter, DHA1 family, multidrug resistance protein
MNKRPSYAILIAISAVGPLALNIFMPSLPGLQNYFGVSYATAQLTLTLYLIGMAVCQLIYGPLSDRYGRRPLLLAGMAIFVAASFAASLAPSIEWLIAARLLQAIGGSSGIVLARAMIRDVYDREKSASVISYVTMAFVLAPMVAPTLGGLLDGFAGWQGGFYLMLILGALVLTAAVFTLPETHLVGHHEAAGGGFFSGAAELFKIPRFCTYTLTLGFASGVFFSFLGGAPHIMVDVLHKTPVEYGLWFAVVSVGYIFGNFLSGRYTQRVGIDRMIMFGCLVTAIGGAACLAAAIGDMLSPATLFLPMAFAALGNGLTIPNGTAGAISVNPRLTGAAAGWSGFAQMAMGAAASQLVGMLQGQWPLAIFWFMGVASVLALIVHGAATHRKYAAL